MAKPDRSARELVALYGTPVREVLGQCVDCGHVLHLVLVPGFGDDLIEPQAGLRVIRDSPARHHVEHVCGGRLRLVA